MTTAEVALSLLGQFLDRIGLHDGGEGCDHEIWCGFHVCNPVATHVQPRNVQVSAPEGALVEKALLERWNVGLST